MLDNFSTGSRANSASFLESIERIKGDLRNLDDSERATVGIDYVSHQDTIPSAPRSVSDSVLSHEARITGTPNILAAARPPEVKRSVMASSSRVYGDQESEYKHEDLQLNPLSPYAATKAEGRHLHETACSYSCPE